MQSSKAGLALSIGVFMCLKSGVSMCLKRRIFAGQTTYGKREAMTLLASGTVTEITELISREVGNEATTITVILRRVAK
jgi:hypothetical protein